MTPAEPGGSTLVQGPPSPEGLRGGGGDECVPAPVAGGTRSAQEFLNLHGLRESAEVIDGSDKRAQGEVLVATLNFPLDRLGGEAGCQPSPDRAADVPKEAADLRLAAVGEFGDPSLTEPTLVPVKDCLSIGGILRAVRVWA